MPPVGFEPTISVGERLQTYASDRAATGPARNVLHVGKYIYKNVDLFHILHVSHFIGVKFSYWAGEGLFNGECNGSSFSSANRHHRLA